jgi:hypothetical protein
MTPATAAPLALTDPTNGKAASGVSPELSAVFDAMNNDDWGPGLSDAETDSVLAYFDSTLYRASLREFCGG